LAQENNVFVWQIIRNRLTWD